MKLRHVFLCFSWVALFAVCFVGAPVQAQSPADNGQLLAEKAKRDHDLGRLNEAIEGYTQAYQLTGDLNLLFSLAEAHREAGHAADAVKIFQTYLRRDPKGIHSESAEKQIKELERAQKTGAGKAPAPAAGQTTAKPASAAPTTAKAPAAVPFAPPPVIAKPAPVALPPPVIAKPAPVVPPPPAVAKPAPPPPRLPPAPPATLIPTAPEPAEPSPVTTVVISGGEPPPAPGVSPPLPRWVPWTLAVTTVALGTGAIISGLSASDRYDELRDSCGQSTGGCTAEQIDDVKSRAFRANILWTLAGVAALGTGVTVYVNANAAGVAGLWAF